MTISRFLPVQRSYQFTPRLAALIELKYGHDADNRVAKAIIEDLQLPRVVLVRSAHAESYRDCLVDPSDALIDVEMPSLVSAVATINRMTGCRHSLVCVNASDVGKVAEYDGLYSSYSDDERVIALLDDLTHEIRKMEYSA